MQFSVTSRVFLEIDAKVPFRVLLEEKEKKNGHLRVLITCESPMFSLTTMNTQFIGTYQ
jgi:hypothetical protein